MPPGGLERQNTFSATSQKPQELLRQATSADVGEGDERAASPRNFEKKKKEVLVDVPKPKQKKKVELAPGELPAGFLQRQHTFSSQMTASDLRKQATSSDLGAAAGARTGREKRKRSK